MKLLIPVCAAAVLLAACGQRDEPPRAAESPADAPADAPVAPPPAPATEPPASLGGTATAQMAPTQGHEASGTLTLTAEANAVRVSGSLSGLQPNAEFGFHIHEKGDCSAPDASSAGGHFNPANAQHGNPAGEAHHAGDMLNVKSDAQGGAQVDTQATGVTLSGGQPNDVLGKAIVLHAKPDDYATQPSGNSGARIACGVIAG
jgi:superoxide dismutase, Cu-Zn family